MKANIRRMLVVALFLISVPLVAEQPSKLPDDVAKREEEIVKAVKSIAPHLSEMAKKQYGLSVSTEEIQAKGVDRAIEDKVQSIYRGKRPDYEVGVEFNKRLHAVLVEGKYFKGFSYSHFITRDSLLVFSPSRYLEPKRASEILEEARLHRLKLVSTAKADIANANATFLLATAVLYADSDAVREFAKLAKDTEKKGYSDSLGLDAAIDTPDRFLVRERIYIAIKVGLDGLPAPKTWTKP